MLNVKSVAAFISTVALATSQVEGLVTRTEDTEDALPPLRGPRAGSKDARRTCPRAPRIVMNFRVSD